MARRCGETLDLLAWHPPEVAERFDEAVLKTATFHARLCRAMKMALAECNLDRVQVAERMSAYLDEAVTKAMLDAYVSEAKTDNTINVERFAALIHATEDTRLLSVIAEPFGCVVFPARYEAAVREAILADKIDELAREKDAARRAWRRP